MLLWFSAIIHVCSFMRCTFRMPNTHRHRCACQQAHSCQLASLPAFCVLDGSNSAQTSAVWDAPVVAFVKSLQDGAAQGIAVQLRCVQDILEDLRARAPPLATCVSGCMPHAWSSEDAWPVDPWVGDCSKASLQHCCAPSARTRSFLKLRALGCRLRIRGSSKEET